MDGVAESSHLRVETLDFMGGTMHITLGNVIVFMHRERSRLRPRPLNIELLWVYESIIRVFDHETLVMYALSA